MSGPPWPDVRRPRSSRLVLRVGLSALASVLLAGCLGRVHSTSAPSSQPHIGVVNLEVVTRAHPRWQELDAVLRQVQEVEAELAQLPPPPATPAADVGQALDAEAHQLQAELERELEFLKQDGQRRLATFADELRSEQEASLEQTRHDLQAQGELEIMTKRDELRAQLRAAEQQIRNEYRYPLLNLRLRVEVAGLTSEDEAKQLQQQLLALEQERADRIAAKAEETQQAFAEFRQTKEGEINTKLQAAHDALQVEGQRRLSTREQELQGELRQAAQELDHTYRVRLDRRRQELLAAIQGPPPGRPATYAESLIERSRRLRAELGALQEQRARLEASILAEVKVDIAAIAQDRKLDVVLTRFIANGAGMDITTDVVQKLKR